MNSIINYFTSAGYDLFTGLLLGLICPFIVDWIKSSRKTINTANSQIINTLWESAIFEGSTVIKRDEIRVIQDKKPGTLYGFVNRRFPEHLNNRCWHMRGVCKDDKVVCMNWSDQFNESMCCATLTQEDANTLSGNYYRYDAATGKDISFKIELHKIRELRFFERIKLIYLRHR